MNEDALRARVAELEEVLTLICGAFPTKLIGHGDPHVPNAKVQKVCAELRSRRDHPEAPADLRPDGAR